MPSALAVHALCQPEVLGLTTCLQNLVEPQQWPEAHCCQQVTLMQYFMTSELQNIYFPFPQ
jgi:hypothetical protein